MELPDLPERRRRLTRGDDRRAWRSLLLGTVFFISDEKYTRVQTPTLEALIRKPIKELVDEIDPDLFWQIHRSTLVNTHCISGVTRDLRGRQIVSIKGSNEKLEVSRSYTHLFKGM